VFYSELNVASPTTTSKMALFFPQQLIESAQVDNFLEFQDLNCIVVDAKQTKTVEEGPHEKLLAVCKLSGRTYWSGARLA
jgi:hypothetical protein